MSDIAATETTGAASTAPPRSAHREMQTAFTSVAQPPLAAFEALVGELLTMQVKYSNVQRITIAAVKPHRPPSLTERELTIF